MADKTLKICDLPSKFNVLRTESKAEAAKILTAVKQDIGPIDFLESMWVGEVAYYTWETMRYRRIKTGILNNAMKRALQQIMNRVRFPGLLCMNQTLFLEDRKASEILAHDWFIDPESRSRTLSLLEESGLDESAIEAEAYTLVAKDLENADRMLKSAEDGRDKALRSLVKYRKNLAVHARRNSDGLLAADKVPSVADVSLN